MKKLIIYPSVLEKDFRVLERKLNIARKLSKKVQVDVCDGKFVPSKTFASYGGYISALKLKKAIKNLYLELDMMVLWQDKKNDYFERWINFIIFLKPHSVVIHKKSVNENNFRDILYILKKEKIKIGLGVHLFDKNSDIEKIIKDKKVDYIQIMGIEKVGYSGEKLSSKTYTKIKYFRSKFPNFFISVDGGVKEDNLDKLHRAGANAIGANSMVFKSKHPKRFFRLF